MKCTNFLNQFFLRLIRVKLFLIIFSLISIISCGSDDSDQINNDDDKVIIDDEDDTDVIDSNLFFEENFDYGGLDGDITGLSDWERYGGSADPIQYIPASLTFTGYPSSGGAIEIVNGSGSREDILRSFDAQNTGTIYSAQLINVSSATVGNYFYSLSDNGDGFFARIFAKDDGSGNLLFGTALNLAGGGTESYTTTTYDFNTTYLVVVKYNFSTAISSLYVITDTIPTTEPSTADASANSGDLPTSLDGIKYRQNNEVLDATVDGIRIGNTWKVALGITD